MPTNVLPDLDPLIHSRIRLGILSILIAVREATFTYLKEKLNVTDGNLSANINKLELEGYIEVIKAFKGKRPQTSCRITEKGRKAFKKYVDTLEMYYLPRK